MPRKPNKGRHVPAPRNWVTHDILASDTENTPRPVGRKEAHYNRARECIRSSAPTLGETATSAALHFLNIRPNFKTIKSPDGDLITGGQQATEEVQKQTLADGYQPEYVDLGILCAKTALDLTKTDPASSDSLIEATQRQLGVIYNKSTE